MANTNMDSMIEKLSNPEIQGRLMDAAKTAVRNQLEKEGIELTPALVAEILARSQTSRDPAETLAAGAVFIATVALFSDARLKENVRKVGVSESGIGIYEYSHRGFSTRWRGVMAQELLESHADAVCLHPSGFLVVDYSKIDVSFGAA